MNWRPAKALGLVMGLVIALTLVALDAFLVQSLIGKEIDLNLYATGLLLVLSAPLLVFWGLWYYRLISLRYYLDRNALVIECGTSWRIVPMREIRRIIPGRGVAVAEGFRGMSWPGFLMGRMRLEEWGPLVVCATEPLERQWVVVTDALCYGISPRPAQRFLLDFAARQALEPIRAVEMRQEFAPLAALPVWRDRWFWSLILLAAVANAVLFGVIAHIYGSLPERLPVGLFVHGEASHIVVKTGLLVIPGIGASTLIVNALLGLLCHHDERLGAYLLAGMGLFIQAVLWLAMLGTWQR